MSSKILKFTVASVFVASFAASAFAQSDKIFIVGQEKAVAATIEDETLSEVKYKQGALSTQQPWEKVSRVEYGAGNSQFAKAEDNLRKGDFPAAQTILEAIKVEREIFNPRKLYMLGKCLEGQGKFKDAEAKFNELVSKYEKSLYTKLAIRSLVEAQIKTGNFAGAVSTADKGTQVAQSVKNNVLAVEFRLIKGSVLEAQNKGAEAEAEYRGVAGASDAGRIAKLGECGIARIAAKTGDVDKVKSIVDPIIKTNDPVLLPAAYTAMGEALLSRGVQDAAKGGAERIREAAVENFLRVIVQCPPAPNESQDDLERSMFGYATAAKRLSEIEKAKEQVEFWKGQVSQHCKEFLQRFPNSRFRKQVEELQR